MGQSKAPVPFAQEKIELSDRATHGGSFKRPNAEWIPIPKATRRGTLEGHFPAFLTFHAEGMSFRPQFG